MFSEHFDNLDRSKGKFLTPNEYGNTNAFKAMDNNKNGKISKDEFLGFHRGNFKTMDRDKDGVLSTDEL